MPPPPLDKVAKKSLSKRGPLVRTRAGKFTPARRFRFSSRLSPASEAWLECAFQRIPRESLGLAVMLQRSKPKLQLVNAVTQQSHLRLQTDLTLGPALDPR